MLLPDVRRKVVTSGPDKRKIPAPTFRAAPLPPVNIDSYSSGGFPFDSSLPVAVRKEVCCLRTTLSTYGKAILKREGALSASHCEGHDGVLDVHAVLGLVVDDGLGAVDDGVGDFDTPVGGEAVHVDGVFFCQGHAALIADPVLVLLDGAGYF